MSVLMNESSNGDVNDGKLPWQWWRAMMDEKMTVAEATKMVDSITLAGYCQWNNNCWVKRLRPW